MVDLEGQLIVDSFGVNQIADIYGESLIAHISKSITDTTFSFQRSSKHSSQNI